MLSSREKMEDWANQSVIIKIGSGEEKIKYMISQDQNEEPDTFKEMLTEESYKDYCKTVGLTTI